LAVWINDVLLASQFSPKMTIATDAYKWPVLGLVSLEAAGLGLAGPTRPTSHWARVSERTRLTRLLANPSHRHKRLRIYCRCRYFLIFPLLTYCCPRPRYIFFAQDGRRKGCVPEAKVVQNRQFISTDIRLNTSVFCARLC